MKSLRFSILVLVVIINSFNCDRTNNDFNAKCCDNSTDQRVAEEFTSNIVQHEYIVQFKKYYQAEARAKFLRAALGGEVSECSECTDSFSLFRF